MCCSPRMGVMSTGKEGRGGVGLGKEVVVNSIAGLQRERLSPKAFHHHHHHAHNPS